MNTKLILEILINKSIKYRNMTQNDEYYADYYKLNKLLYIAHGITLALYDKKLINSNICNSNMGSYIEETIYLFFDWGVYPITREYEEFPIPPDYIEIIDYIVKYFGTMDKWQLSIMCKQHPYFNKSLKGGNLEIVQNEDIKNYFLSLGILDIVDKDYPGVKINKNVNPKLILTKGINFE